MKTPSNFLNLPERHHLRPTATATITLFSYLINVVNGIIINCLFRLQVDLFLKSFFSCFVDVHFHTCLMLYGLVDISL